MAEPNIPKIENDAIFHATMTCLPAITQAYRYFRAQGKNEEDFDRCAREAMTKAVRNAVQLTAREVKDPVWPYAIEPAGVTVLNEPLPMPAPMTPTRAEAMQALEWIYNHPRSDAVTEYTALRRFIDLAAATQPAPSAEVAVQDEFLHLFGLAHEWAQECYFKGLGRESDIDGKRGEFAVALRLAAATQGAPTLDNCERCKGARGGVLGNENRVNGKVLCDYCTVEVMEADREYASWTAQGAPTPAQKILTSAEFAEMHKMAVTKEWRNGWDTFIAVYFGVDRLAAGIQPTPEQAEPALRHDKHLCADCTTEHACKNRLDVPRPCWPTPEQGGAK